MIETLTGGLWGSPTFWNRLGFFLGGGWDRVAVASSGRSWGG